MGRKVVSETIDEVSVTVVQLAPMKALEILPEIMASLAAGMSGLRGVKFDKGDKLTLADAVKLAPALSSIASSFAQGKLVAIVPILLSSTTVVFTNVAGKRTKLDLMTTAAIDEAFDGRLATLAKVCALSVKVTFEDFFPGLGLGGADDPTETPTGST